jgi:hypothetical protein
MSDDRLVKFLGTLKTLIKEVKEEFPTFEFDVDCFPGSTMLELNITTDPDYADWSKEYGLVPNDSGIYDRLLKILVDDPRMKELGYLTHPMMYKINKLTIEYFIFYN